MEGDSNKIWIEKAAALLTLKDHLGSFYDEQKNSLLNQILDEKQNFTEIATLYAKFLEIGFFNSEDLSFWTAKLIGEKKELSASQNRSPQDWREKILPETKLKSIQPFLVSQNGLQEEKIKELFLFLSQLNIETVKDSLELDKNDQSFNVLGDLLTSEQYATFKALIQALKQMSWFEKENKMNIKKQEEIQQKKLEIQKVLSQSYHLWGEDAQILILPLEEKFHFFYISNLKEDDDSVKKKGEHVLFCLDISASMNHDEKRRYCPPKSPDHPASSIKKARNLILPLTMAAVKRQASVTILVWNFKIYPAIEFTPEMFIDQESGEFIGDNLIEEEIKKKTGESVFLAKGGTNIESALKELSKKIETLASQVSNIQCWFLTDGEETVCEGQNGEACHIPTNVSDPKYSYFNSEDETGITNYQRDLVARMKQLSLKISDMQCAIEFHVCHLGEAHPVFLKSLRESLDGHFHAIVDVENIEREMKVAANSASLSITLVGVKTGVKHKVPAATSDGALCSRGELPSDFFLQEIAPLRQLIVFSLRGEKKQLLSCENTELSPKLVQGIHSILKLEPALAKLLDDLSHEISVRNIERVSRELNDLRKQRMEAIAAISRLVKAGTLFQLFFEKTLESVESQMDALERLLKQYQLKQGKEYDKQSANSIDLFSHRDKLAIEAGLESMKVRLGNGFVSQACLDRRIQRIIASNGAWGRKMLNRICLIAETEREDKTILTVYIVDNDEIKNQRNQLLSTLSEDNVEIQQIMKNLQAVNFKEDLTHDENTNLVSKITISLLGRNGKKMELKKSIPTHQLYPNRVATLTVTPQTEDLHECYKKYLDPLSFSHFVDLIEENNTLPAYLYTIAASQSVGLLYDSQEHIHVVKCASSMTSFDYFRLYWRLAKKDDPTEEIQVPGTFAKANSAIPIAPEPFTNLVLSSLMPGLLSEFITGSAMAPLKGTGMLYIGYLLYHMRSDPHTGLDITRIAEFLATLSCWVENPHTIPKPEDFEALIDSLVKEQGVSNSDSPGKNIPIKAFALSLLDERHSPITKFSAIQREIIRRYSKLIVCPKLGEEKNNLALAQNQISIKDFFIKLIENLTDTTELQDGIPEAQLDMAQRLSHLFQNSEKLEEIISFLIEKKHLSVIISALANIFHSRSSSSFPQFLHWHRIQRLLFVWYAISIFPIADLKRTFSAFKSPEKFENHLTRVLQVLKGKENLFKHALFSWIAPVKDPLLPEGIDFFFLNYQPEGQIEICSIRRNKTWVLYQNGRFNTKLEEFEYIEGLKMIWRAFLVVAHLWSQFWKGHRSNCFGLSEIDYDVVKALKNTIPLESLSVTQLAEYNKAIEYRSETYKKFIPPKPEIARLSKEDHFVVKQEPQKERGKSRISVIMIGHIDSGKSTISGHLLYKCGMIDKRALERIEKSAKDFGKPTFKYAWVMDKLREEREKGVTIKSSSWNLEIENFDIDIIDAPGHRSFIKNMAVGASLADVAILLISAAPGEFESGFRRGGMTNEEVLLAYACGIRQFIVVVNKMDTCNYSEARFQEIESNIRPFLKKTGIKEETVPFIPISAWTGENLTVSSSNTPWFKNWTIKRNETTITGTTLIEALNSLHAPLRPIDKPLRIPILNSFAIPGIGTIAVGRVISGQLQRGDKFVINPGGIQAEATTMEIYHTEKKLVSCGEIVGFKVKGVSVDRITRGMVVSSIAHPVKPVEEFVAQIIVLLHPGQLRVGYAPYFLCHTCTFQGSFIELLQKVNKKTNQVEEENPSSIKTGDCAIIRVKPKKPICVESFKDFPPFGRFAIRDLNMTIAVGIIQSINYVSISKPPHFSKKFH